MNSCISIQVTRSAVTKFPVALFWHFSSIQHPNLVSLIGIVQEDTIYLVLEYMGKGNLVEYLRSRGRSVITKKDQINFAT